MPDPGRGGEERRHYLLWPLVLAVTGFLLFCGLVIWYTSWELSVSEHKWCAVVETLTNPPSPTPSPPTETAAQQSYTLRISAELHALEKSLGCR